MRFDLSVLAFDVLDQVWATAHLTMTEDTPGAPRIPVLHKAVRVAGTGETDPRQWTEDVLVALLEEL